LLFTGAVASIFFVPPTGPSLSWQQLFFFVFLYVVIAAFVHSLAVWGVCRVFREHIQQPTWRLNLDIWISVAWLPLIAILNRERSIWICAILPLTIGSAAHFLKRNGDWQDSEEVAASGETGNLGLFYTEEAQPLWQTLFPNAIAVIAAQLGVGALLGGRTWIGGSLFSISLAILIWRSPGKRRAAHAYKNQQRIFRSALRSLLVLLLVGIALMPFLKRGHRTMGIEALLGIQPAPSLRSTIAKDTRPSGTEYSGVILMLPPKPHPEIVPPVHTDDLHLAGTLANPIVIPFDGVYWYFKRPDTRPKSDARVQRGDPLKANIRSTDRLPLLMEAHQVLPTSMMIDCCKALRVELVNADNRPGAITIETWLRDTSTKAAPMLSLGSVVIPSSNVRSISLTRSPINEALTFRFPPGARGRKFDEITLIIRPAKERALAGSQVAIQNFVLVP
jgi:hypothetical protein